MGDLEIRVLTGLVAKHGITKMLSKDEGCWLLGYVTPDGEIEVERYLTHDAVNAAWVELSRLASQEPGHE